MREFLDSPKFAAWLFVVLPMFAFAWRRVNLRANSETTTKPLGQGQFRLSWMLLAMLVGGLVFGIGAVSLAGVYALWMSAAFWLIVLPIVFFPRQRKFAAGIAGFLTAYIVANVGLYFAAGPFRIFETGFMVMVGVLGPFIMIGLLLLGCTYGVAVRRVDSPDREIAVSWRALAGSVMWLAGWAIANVWVIGTIAA